MPPRSRRMNTVVSFVQAAINWFWSTLDSHLFYKGVSRLWYFPSVFRMILMEGPSWRWYDRIDSTVILGAIPFKSQTKELVEEENVRAVLSYNEEFELNYFTNTKKEWDDIGVERSWFSTVDYRPPSLASIREGLEVISEHKLRNECVYIHCKAGRGRSALVASCYLMKDYGYTPAQAIKFLQSKRPQVSMNTYQRKRLAEFYELQSKKNK